jgi:FdhE protein
MQSTVTPPASDEFKRVQRAVERLRGELPQLTNILDAFGPLFAEQAAIKADLRKDDTPALEFDPIRFRQGVPLLDKERFSIPQEQFQTAAARLLPVMATCFPRISESLCTVMHSLQTGTLDSQSVATLATPDSESVVRTVADRLAIDPMVLHFALGQILKPFAQGTAQSLPQLPESAHWFKGYCPVCGSWPELGFLEGVEGRRWLRCSFCAHEWTFSRTQCPFCEGSDPEKMELLYAEDRPHERAELCHICNKYLVSIDLRDRADEVVREVAPLGLVHLDILAQEKGLTPGARCPWNQL